MSNLRKKVNSQSGFTKSIELVAKGTTVLVAIAIGFGWLASKLIGEISDLGSAISDLNQSYSVSGIAAGHSSDPVHPAEAAGWEGSSYADFQDFCDNDPNGACGVRLCIPPAAELPHPTPPSP